MARQKMLRPGYVVIYPNRDKAASKTTKAIVVLLLLVSAGLMLALTIGGWTKLQGMKPVNFVWLILYVVLAYYIAKWNRGLLPIAAAMAILLLILVVIAGLGLAGTSWFDRNHTGFASAQTPFGTSGLGDDILGAITLILAPVQLLLIIFAMQGFLQGWNVEQEVPKDEAERRRGGGGERAGGGQAEPATA